MTTPEISTTKQPMWQSMDCEQLADWLETLNRLHLQTPMVPVDQVTKNPAEAMYLAIRDLQEQIGNLKWEICRAINGPHRPYFTFAETIASLRQTQFSEPPQAAVVAGQNSPERGLTPAAGEMVEVSR